MANNTISPGELAIMEQLHQIASEHAGVSHERLVLLDLDPEKYPGQRISEFYIRSEYKKGPLEPELISSIANSIDSRFSPLEKVFAERHKETPGIQRIVELMRDDNNVVNGTDHAELIDIALSHLALSAVIKRSGLTEIRTALIVSKMVDSLGVQLDDGVVTARELLMLGFNRVWLTIPRSTSTSGKFDEESISQYNRRVRKSIAWSMNRRSLMSRGKGPLLLGVALPGTVNKLLDDGQEQTTVVGQVSEGILAFTGVSNTATVATSIRLDEQSPRFFIDDLPMFVKEPSDIETLMGRLLVGITALDGGNYVYDADGNLPVKRIVRPAKDIAPDS